MIKDVSFFGAGNVAWHLAQMLYDAGVNINTVYSRHKENAVKLAQKTGAVAIDRIEEMPCGAGLYIFALNDDAVKGVAERFARVCGGDMPVVHTGGMLDSDIFKPRYKQYGCFYPLQTFKKEKPLFNKDFPVFITSSNADFGKALYRLSRMISGNVHYIEDDKRKVLHVAAVFVNNFTNYLLSIAAKITAEEGLQLEYLLPLLRETVDKVANGGDPALLQTGPAVRGDSKTMEAHLDFLKKYPQFQKVYDILSRGIQDEKDTDFNTK